MYIVTRISSTSALWMSVTPQLRVNVQSLYNFIVWSKQHAVFESLQERNSDFSGKSTTLKRFSDITSVTDFHFLFPCILMQQVLIAVQCTVKSAAVIHLTLCHCKKTATISAICPWSVHNSIIELYVLFNATLYTSFCRHATNTLTVFVHSLKKCLFSCHVLAKFCVSLWKLTVANTRIFHIVEYQFQMTKKPLISQWGFNSHAHSTQYAQGREWTLIEHSSVHSTPSYTILPF